MEDGLDVCSGAVHLHYPHSVERNSSTQAAELCRMEASSKGLGVAPLCRAEPEFARATG